MRIGTSGVAAERRTRLFAGEWTGRRSRR